ncbi:unnamed protein product [Hapterophycus canaliculatus]
MRFYSRLDFDVKRRSRSDSLDLQGSHRGWLGKEDALGVRSVLRSISTRDGRLWIVCGVFSLDQWRCCVGSNPFHFDVFLHEYPQDVRANASTVDCRRKRYPYFWQVVQEHGRFDILMRKGPSTIRRWSLEYTEKVYAIGRRLPRRLNCRCIVI